MHLSRWSHKCCPLPGWESCHLCRKYKKYKKQNENHLTEVRLKQSTVAGQPNLILCPTQHSTHTLLTPDPTPNTTPYHALTPHPVPHPFLHPTSTLHYTIHNIVPHPYPTLPDTILTHTSRTHITQHPYAHTFPVTGIRKYWYKLL